MGRTRTTGALIAAGKFAPLPVHVSAPLAKLVVDMLSLDAANRPGIDQVLDLPSRVVHDVFIH